MKDSKTTDVIVLCKGANRILSNMDQAFAYKKDYNVECGSGFYTIADEDIAKKYAIKLCKAGETPIVNYYNFELGRMKKDCIRQIYFNDLNAESMDYIGRNISGIFPSNCNRTEKSKYYPKDLCHNCNNEECSWSAPYIEAILSDNVDFTFNDILKAFVVKDITEEEAIEKINEILIQHNSKLRIQVMIRTDVREYLHYSHYQALPVIEETK